MKQTWRWFGPDDPTSLDVIVQAGARGIVSSLHHLESGEAWSKSEISKHQQEIARFTNGAPSGLEWDVVESLVVSEDIKRQSGDFKQHLENYRISLKNLADSGITTVCYNFMPVIDWTRTDLAHRLASGGTAMRFDIVDFAVFDIFLLERPGARHDFSEELLETCERRHAQMTDAEKSTLVQNIVAGLPGSNEKLTLDEVRGHLSQYARISREQLAGHLVDFLGEVVPLAERLGVRLCCHPDDPPFALMGLPRVTSTAKDYRNFLNAVDSPANGMTFCSGSFGARHDNDLLAMIDEFADKIHFAHLRAVKRDADSVPCSFFEDEHLAGDIDMIAIVGALMLEEKRRKREGRSDHQIPMRPDHGQDIADDLGRKGAQPGYPVIGRLKGLAELRGVMSALQHAECGL
ncbi:MAG TPA: mannonate dehydratase [Devosia sp.]|nr:mannonate dehydratase [Devosia sp.]